MNIAICEDNRAAAAEAEAFIRELRLERLECDVFYDGKELVCYLEKQAGEYQIYLLDIRMPGLDGIRTAKRIRERDRNAVILFMTDYTEFVFDVFEVQPFRFLPKPVTRELLHKAVRDAVDYLYTMKKYVTFVSEKERLQIACDEILYLESDRRKVRLHTRGGGSYEFYGKLAELQRDLDGNLFLRVHVSYLISIAHIRRLLKDEVELDSGVRLPVSRKYREEVREKQLAFVKWRNGI